MSKPVAKDMFNMDTLMEFIDPETVAKINSLQVQGQAMTNLHQGDEVHWNDPDNGTCSGYGIFQSYKSDEVAEIYKDGELMEVYVHELS